MIRPKQKILSMSSGQNEAGHELLLTVSYDTSADSITIEMHNTKLRSNEYVLVLTKKEAKYLSMSLNTVLTFRQH